MHLLPDQIPNPFHFLDEYHDRVVPRFVEQVRHVHNTNPDTFGSTEPCWEWKGTTRMPDLPVDLIPYFKPPKPIPLGEDYQDDPDLFAIRPDPVFDLASVLTEQELVQWTPGQLQHLKINPNLIASCMKHNQWRQVYEVFDLPKFYTTCLQGECLQPWHLIPTTSAQEVKRQSFAIERAKVVRQFTERKLAYEVSVARAAKFGHATNRQRGGPQLVIDSPEYNRRATWLALFQVKLEKALRELEASLLPHRVGRGGGLPISIPDDEFRERILATAERRLDQTGECWLVKQDLVNGPANPNEVITFEGRSYSLARVLFVVYTNTPIPKGGVVRRTCMTPHCHTPSHRTLVI